jgi:hypothetical protein
MSKFNGPHNAPNQGKIAKIAHLRWSKTRAWHGDEVKLLVETEVVPDGTAVELTIFPKGGATAVDTVKGLTIKGLKAEAKYKIDWKDKPLPKSGNEFVFRAVVGKLKGESPVLLVDIAPPVLSA